MPRRILLFDVMDTLVADPFRDALPAFFGLTLAELLEQKHPTAWVDFELGRLTEVEYANQMFADRRPVDFEALAQHLQSAYRWVDGAEELLLELRNRGLEMHALSNYPTWYRLIEDKLQLSRYVAWSFVSCTTRVRKPDPEAYKNVVSALGVSPQVCVFIDDRRVNCDAADRAGMTALHFQGVSALRSALRQLDLL